MPALNASLARALAEVRDDEIVAFTRALARIPSVYRPDDSSANETAVAHAEAEWLGPHQVDEHVEVSELCLAARCYVAAAVRYLSAGV